MIRTTFANGRNPFSPPTTKTRREVSYYAPPVRKIFDVIRTRPGVTAGDLIAITRNTAAGEYAKKLLDAGEVTALMQRTKPCQHIRGVRHFYPLQGPTE